MQMMFDSHNHTEYSHDSDCEMDLLCRTAKSKGFSGIVISDHCDIQYYKDDPSCMDNVKKSVIEANRIKRKYEGDLTVLAGIELGEAIWNPEAVRHLLAPMQLDVILSSVHSVRYKNFEASFSMIDFSDWNDVRLNEYMNQYFDDMQEMVDTVDMDILTHLTNPLKYINGKYGHCVSCEPYMRKIDAVLKTIIQREIALELNISCVASAHHATMPDETIIRRYKDLGGNLVTIGSDAHRAECFGVHFDYALNLLKKCGFTQYVYFRNRTCTAVEIVD